MGLSTHVLDQVSGQPASDLKIDLLFEGNPLGAFATNEDGRVADLLGENALSEGTYTLVFKAGDYLKAAPHLEIDTPFFDKVQIDFTVSDTTRHYHVPLLISPYGYSTYRGS
ncbi:MAG: hydroxyisourate hydrolase [Ponticaulis sp.]|nr:hydroxyisourate hydrolase [Ponticaulis sp.]